MDTADLRSLGQSIEGVFTDLDATQAALTQSEADLAVAQAQVAELEGDLADLRAKTVAQPVHADALTGPSTFGIYNGAGAYTQQGARLATNVEIVNGVLSVYARPVTTPTTIGGKPLAPGDYAAGGAMWKQTLSPGCRIELDMQMTPSTGTRAVCLLWPVGVPWPAGGELDFVENGGVASQADRQSTVVTNHWGVPDPKDATKVKNAQESVPFGPHDFTVGTHVTVLWQTDLFVVTIDGVEAARFTTHVPTNDMQLAFQTAVEGGGQSPMYGTVARTPGVLRVKNLKVYDA